MLFEYLSRKPQQKDAQGWANRNRKWAEDTEDWQSCTQSASNIEFDFRPTRSKRKGRASLTRAGISPIHPYYHMISLWVSKMVAQKTMIMLALNMLKMTENSRVIIEWDWNKQTPTVCTQSGISSSSCSAYQSFGSFFNLNCNFILMPQLLYLDRNGK